MLTRVTPRDLPGRAALLSLTVTSGLIGCTLAAAAATAPAAAVTPGSADTTQGSTVLPPREAPASSWSPPARRPNFLLITADDASVDDLAYMPRLRKLLTAQGTTFDGVAPTPICVPARASILTGQYSHNHGALTIEGEDGGFDSFDDRRTLPVWLRRAGYDTMLVGKYLNGYGVRSPRYVPPGWTDWQGSIDPTTYTFDRALLNANGRPTSYRNYNTDVFRDVTNSRLAKPRRRKRPWFMWVNYVAPHHGGPVESDDPLATFPFLEPTVMTPMPAQRHRNMFRGLKLPRKPDMFALGSRVPETSPSREFTWSRDGRAALREAQQQRLESLQAVDEAIASHIRTLRRTRQLGRTYVIFTSDNGYALGEHNLYGKLWHYREPLEIPIVVRGPGVPRGRTSPTTVTNPDLPVSIAAAAQAKPMRRVDGVNVFDHLRGTSEGTRVVPIEAYPVRGGERALYKGIRLGDWTYVRFRNGSEEMYDGRTDPYQMRNLVKAPAYLPQLRELRVMTQTYKTCAGHTCPQAFYR